MILYGSIVRGESNEESDIDFLVLTRRPLTRYERHQITDIVFEINLEFETNISTLVVDHNTWTTGTIAVLPIHAEIEEEGYCCDPGKAHRGCSLMVVKSQ